MWIKIKSMVLMAGFFLIGSRAVAQAEELTALMELVKTGPTLEAVQEILSAKAEQSRINRQNQAGETALTLYAANASKVKDKETKIAILQTLIDNGADASLQYPDGKTVFMRVAEVGDADVIQYFLDNLDSLNSGNISIDYTDHGGKTALFWAVEKRSAVVTQKLLAKGASAKIAETKGYRMTPLIAATRQGWVEGVKLLLASGAGNVELEAKDAHGMTALMCAAEQGNPEQVELLLGAGASPSVLGPDGKTSLMLAIISDKPETIDVLLHNKNGLASIDYADNEGKTALFRAVEKKSVASTQKLLAKRANPNIVETKGYLYTPLMVAAAQDTPEILQLLLNAGAQADAVDSNGRTILFIAVEHKQLSTVAKILDMIGTSTLLAYMGVGPDKQTPLMKAVEMGWVEGVQLFAKKKESLNAKDIHEKTALHYAVYQSFQKRVFPGTSYDEWGTHIKIYPDIIELLVAAGASTIIKDKEGNTAWDLMKNNPWFSANNDLDKKIILIWGGTTKSGTTRYFDKCNASKKCSLSSTQQGYCCTQLEESIINPAGYESCRGTSCRAK